MNLLLSVLHRSRNPAAARRVIDAAGTLCYSYPKGRDHGLAYTELQNSPAEKACLSGGNEYVAVIGGVNLDIGAHPFGPLKAGDSNPGRVILSPGGVGRNIAHNLRLLGVDVQFLTAFGNDVLARTVIDSCTALKIDITHALRVPDGTTSTYLFLCDSEGDMAAAVSDMAICDEISPSYLIKHADVINGAGLVVADTNIPASSLAWLAEHCTAPLFVDPVSTKKAEKLKPILGKLHTLKPNRMEAASLSGIEISDRTTLEAAAQVLLETGLQRVFISLGAEGVLAADQHEMVLIPCCPAVIRNATGAGDAFMAGLAWAWLEGRNLTDAGRFASAAASLSVESATTINPALSVGAVRNRLRASAK